MVVELVADRVVLAVAAVLLVIVPVDTVRATGATEVPTVVAIARTGVRGGGIAIEDANAARSRKQRRSRNGGPSAKRNRNCRRRP